MSLLSETHAHTTSSGSMCLLSDYWKKFRLLNSLCTLTRTHRGTHTRANTRKHLICVTNEKALLPGADLHGDNDSVAGIDDLITQLIPHNLHRRTREGGRRVNDEKEWNTEKGKVEMRGERAGERERKRVRDRARKRERKRERERIF